MTVTQYIVIGIIIASLLITRNIHEIITKGAARSADGYVHMVIAREFQNNGHRIPESISASVFDWKFSYPYFLHLIMSFFSQKYYQSVDRAFSTMMDFSYIGVLILLPLLNFVSKSEFFMLLGIFVATPQFIQYSGGKGLSARKPGIILGTISILSFVVWSTGGNNWILLGSITSAGLTHLTSRFGTQAITFMYIGLSFLHPISLLVIFSSIIIAVLISRGAYLHILRSHLWFLRDFALRKQFVFLHNGFKSKDTAVRLIKSNSISDVLATVYDSILIRSLLNNPYIVGAVIIILWNRGTSVTSVPTEMLVWLLTGVICYILTTFYGLRFLGQPGRYLNYTFIPGSLIIIDGSQTLPIRSELFQFILIAVGLTMFAGEALANRRLATTSKEKCAFNETISHLKSGDKERILVQPRHIGAEVAWKIQDCAVCDLFGNGWTSPTSVEKPNEIFSGDPYVTSDTSVISQEVNPTKVVFEKESKIPEGCLMPPRVEPEYENEFYSIYDYGSCYK